MKQLVVLAASFMLIFAACSQNDSTTSPPETGSLELNISGLADLGTTAKYEGWLIVNDMPVSTGKFTVDASGQMSETSFEVSSSDLDNATTFILTVEPEPDPSTDPSDVHLIAGDFSGNSASLSIGHSAALGDDFSSATGKYILATPTTSDTMDENSGIWFLDLSSGMPAVGLSLPTLPAGWKYEGWTVISGIPVTSGKFTAVDVVDESDPYSNSENPGPPFPGEDYVQNPPLGLTFPTMLDGGIAVISIEPDPDNSPDPFLLKPLTGTVPDPATDHVTYNMTNQSAGNPTGTAMR
ncbi:MAG: hypothetical protein Kow0098_01180 [Ignavibacteriaceae bacterium]